MKTSQTLLTIFCLSAGLFSIINFALAQEGYQLSVPIPTPAVPTGVQAIATPAQYVQTIYNFGLGIGALLAIAVITFGAIKYAVSAGNVAQQSDAKDMILNAIWGLALLLGAFLILYTINPRLTRLELAEIKPIGPVTNVFGNLDNKTFLEKQIEALESKFRDARKKELEAQKRAEEKRAELAKITDKVQHKEKEIEITRDKLVQFRNGLEAENTLFKQVGLKYRDERFRLISRIVDASSRLGKDLGDPEILAGEYIADPSKAAYTREIRDAANTAHSVYVGYVAQEQMIKDLRNDISIHEQELERLQNELSRLKPPPTKPLPGQAVPIPEF